jgi:hypothetical protein
MNNFRKLLPILLLLGSFPLRAQNENIDTQNHYFASISAGPLFGKIIDRNRQGKTIIGGTGLQLDFKAGFDITPNLILNGSYVLNKISNPHVESPAVNMDIDISIDEKILGGGLTYYFKPSNFFISGLIGPGYFKLIDPEDLENTVITCRGLSCQVKCGKEWSILKNLSLGVSCTYGNSRIKHFTIIGDEILISNRFGILMNLTYH